MKTIPIWLSLFVTAVFVPSTASAQLVDEAVVLRAEMTRGLAGNLVFLQAGKVRQGADGAIYPEGDGVWLTVEVSVTSIGKPPRVLSTEAIRAVTLTDGERSYAPTAFVWTDAKRVKFDDRKGTLRIQKVPTTINFFFVVPIELSHSNLEGVLGRPLDVCAYAGHPRC